MPILVEEIKVKETEQSLSPELLREQLLARLPDTHWDGAAFVYSPSVVPDWVAELKPKRGRIQKLHQAIVTEETDDVFMQKVRELL